MTEEWTKEDTKNMIEMLGWFGKKLAKVTVIAGLAAGTGLVGLGALSALKDADYPLE